MNESKSIGTKNQGPAGSFNRRRFLQMAAAGSAAIGLGTGCSVLPRSSRSHSEGQKRQPNIVLIYVDDQGYGELGCYGEKEIPTPHIDSIAKNGVRFTQAYVSCPWCTPSRAGLLMGRYQQRYGADDAAGPDNELPHDDPTIAERLKSLGYATGMVGKWHLGDRIGARPTERGFDEFYGFLGGGHFFLAGKRSENEGFYKALSGPIMRGTEEVEQKEYLTDEFGKEAASFIERHREKPFFLYVPFNAVHVPLEATEEYLARFPQLKGARKIYAAMTASLDDAVGRILDTLRKNNLEENTLVFYMSDNGGHPMANTSQNGPLRAEKGTVYEGGIRVPMLMQWKGVVPAGRVFDKPVIAMDLTATSLAVAGGAMPTEGKLDGVDLLPYLTGKNSTDPHKVLYWRDLDKRALRKGDWKLVEEAESEAPELYNLAEDIGEKKNLAKERPEKLRELEEAYAAMNAQMKDPEWASILTVGRLRKQGKPIPQLGKPVNYSRKAKGYAK